MSGGTGVMWLVLGASTNSGTTYRFIAGQGADDVKVARARKWLLRLVTCKVRSNSQDTPTNIVPVPAVKLDRARAFAEAARRSELDRVTEGQNHERNNTLNRAAFKLGQLLPYGILEEQAVTADLAQAALQIGLDAGEIQSHNRERVESGRANIPEHCRFLPRMRKSRLTRLKSKTTNLHTS